MIVKRLKPAFFQRDVLEVAPDLLGKQIVRVFPDKSVKKYIITETEAYKGEEDLASHASKGRTARTEVMYHKGGKIYVYIIYGMYWMLNFVTGSIDHPQAVLIRAIEGHEGPGKLSRELHLDHSFYGEELDKSDRLYVTDIGIAVKYSTGKRVGVDNAGNYWKNLNWRFILKNVKK